MEKTYKCLSVHPWHAWPIATGNKTAEYRSWATTHRGELLICTTKKPYKENNIIVPGGITLCLVDIVDVTPMVNGGYAWQLENVCPVEPQFVKGQQRIYTRVFDLIEHDGWPITWAKHFDRILEIGGGNE